VHDPLCVAFTVPRPWPKRMAVTGHRYWPALVTVWHREPGGHDSGTICRHYTQRDGKVYLSDRWRVHAHHWKVQIHFLQGLRRRLLTRCAWCAGRHTKGDPVNVSHSWDGPRAPWWRGERGLYHRDCSAIKTAHCTCVCELPVLEHGTYGRCARCGRFRAFGTTPTRLGGRDHVAMRRVEELVAADQADQPADQMGERHRG
jgi:hypothetical protein